MVVPPYRDLVGFVRLRLSELAFSAFPIIGIWSLQQSRRWFLMAVGNAAVGIVSGSLALRGGHVEFAVLSPSS